MEIRVSQVYPHEGHKRKGGDEHPNQQTLLAEVKEYYMPAGLSVHRPEDLIGSQHWDLPVVNPRVPLCSGATGVLTKEGAVAIHEGSQQRE